MYFFSNIWLCSYFDKSIIWLIIKKKKETYVVCMNVKLIALECYIATIVLYESVHTYIFFLIDNRPTSTRPSNPTFCLRCLLILHSHRHHSSTSYIEFWSIILTARSTLSFMSATKYNHTGFRFQSILFILYIKLISLLPMHWILWNIQNSISNFLNHNIFKKITKFTRTIFLNYCWRLFDHFPNINKTGCFE